MAIVKMKQLRLIAMAGDRDRLLRLLQRMGCVEVDEALTQEEQTENLVALREKLSRSDPRELNNLRDQKSQADRALAVLKRHAPEKTGFLQPKPRVGEAELFDEQAFQAAREQAEEIDRMDRRLTAIQSELGKLAAQKGVLLPWAALDVPLDTGSTAQVTVQLGTLPAALPFETGAQAAQRAGDMAQLTCVSSDREQHYCLLVCHTSQSEGVLEALKEVGWSRANLREWQGTAADNLARLEEMQQALDQEQGQLEARLSAMGGCTRSLQRLVDRCAAQVSRQEAENRLLDTQTTFYLEGWIPAERWPELEQELAACPCAWEVDDPAPEDYPKVPVQLKNNWLTRPMNMITEMYSLPAYGSLDPNPLMAPFFILFYGMMMADMGYGLVMLLAGAIVLKMKRPGGTMAHLCGLLVLCGVSTFLFGAVTGGFFGDFIPRLVTMLNPESTFALPALFNPVDDTLAILVGSLALGLVQIVTGMGISFWKKCREGQLLDALFEEVTWWTILGGLALTVVGITNLVLLAGGALLLAGSVWKGMQKGGGPGKVVLNALVSLGGSLYNNIPGYFQDILSYARLMPLMLSGAVVAQVFNTLGSIPGNVIFFVIVSMAGNALNFALNLLGCYVHDMRLQCLEYFNRFYQDGGRPFRPLNYSTQYVDVHE